MDDQNAYTVDDADEIETGPTPEQLAMAGELLGKMLGEDGSVSTTALRKELERKGMGNARELVVALRLRDGSENADCTTGLQYSHSGRSFYTPAALQELERQTDEAASRAEDAEAEEEPSTVQKKKREEARLVRYVETALEELYWTDYGPEAHDYVFDVHDQRMGSDLENVDVLAVHWRSDRQVDLVSVEVKLELSARLVQQANNYLRFSDRVWIAVPVRSDPTGAAIELKEQSPRLFEYIIERGIGILACRRCQGRSYKAFPIHWPRRAGVDPLERDEFVDRYRGCLERAGVVPPDSAHGFPAL